MDNLKEIWNEIVKLNHLDNATTSDRLCKLFEESGELARAVNRTTGRKKHQLNQDDVRNEIIEEGADSIQCIISLLDSLGFTSDDLIDWIKIKNKKWEELITKSQHH